MSSHHGLGRYTSTIAAALGVSVTAWMGYKLHGYVINQLRLRRILAEYREMLIPDPEQMSAIKADFLQQMRTGLLEEIQATGLHLLQLPTYVVQLPTGHEVGDVYAIDLGGTNFRVMHIKLGAGRGEVAHVAVHEVKIPPEVYTGTGTGLFDFLAKETKHFLDQVHTSEDPPVIGFCFSFPMDQTALDKGTLIDWTKGFKCTGVKGEDPVALLNAALQRVGRPCRITALLNDTVGVLAAQRYSEPSTSIGVILGTGTNACYVERLSNVKKWQPSGQPLPPDTHTAINMEWSAFYSAHLPSCPEDADVDAATVHAGKYLYEKMVSGMFLGEIARRVILKIAAETQMLGDFSSNPEAAMILARLATPNAFSTADLCAVVEDASPLLTTTRSVLVSSIGATPAFAPYSSRVVVREVCQLVAARSARLVAVALDAILTETEWTAAKGKTTIAFDGGVYENFAAYRALLKRNLCELRGADAHALNVQLCHDGSCLGAAVLAAAALSGSATSPAPQAAAAVPESTSARSVKTHPHDAPSAPVELTPPVSHDVLDTINTAASPTPAATTADSIDTAGSAVPTATAADVASARAPPNKPSATVQHSSVATAALPPSPLKSTAAAPSTYAPAPSSAADSSTAAAHSDSITAAHSNTITDSTTAAAQESSSHPIPEDQPRSATSSPCKAASKLNGEVAVLRSPLSPNAAAFTPSSSTIDKAATSIPGASESVPGTYAAEVVNGTDHAEELVGGEGDDGAEEDAVSNGAAQVSAAQPNGGGGGSKKSKKKKKAKK